MAQIPNSENARQWEEIELRIEIDGYVDDPTATIACLVLEASLTDGEEALLAYGDAVIRCSEPQRTSASVEQVAQIRGMVAHLNSPVRVGIFGERRAAIELLRRHPAGIVLPLGK